MDDFVGTYISNNIENFPINVPMPPGGHMEYWTTDVFTRLFSDPQMKAWLEELLASGNGGGAGGSASGGGGGAAQSAAGSAAAPPLAAAAAATTAPASNPDLGAVARSLELAVKRLAQGPDQ